MTFPGASKNYKISFLENNWEIVEKAKYFYITVFINILGFSFLILYKFKIRAFFLMLILILFLY